MYFASTRNLDNLLSLVASEEVTTFEVENLQDPLGSFRWRSTTPGPNVVGQFDIAKTIDFWSTFYTDAIISDWARIRLADTEANLTLAPVIDQSAYIWPGSGTGFFGAVTFVGTGEADFGNVLDQTTGDFSVQLRVRRTTSSSVEPVAGKKSGITVTNAGWSWNIDAADKLIVRITDNVDEAVKETTLAVSNTVFETYTMVADRTVGDQLLLYRDNVVQGSPVSTVLVGSITNARDLLVGSVFGTQGSVEVDEFRFWSIALSSSQIDVGGIADYSVELDPLSLPSSLELYWRANEGSGTSAFDDSGNGLDGTVTNGTRFNTNPDTSPSLEDFDFIHSRNVITSPLSADWFRIDYNYSSNPNGYVDGGALLLDSRFTPDTGHRPNWEVSPNNRAMHQVALSAGGIDRGGGVHKRDLSFVLNGLTETEAWGQLEPLIRERNQVKAVAVVLDEDEQVFPMHNIFYGYLGISNFISPHNRKAINISILEP